MLKEKNIHVVWQVPNSPETNMFDLGLWMAIQSYVEYLHISKVMQNNVQQTFKGVSPKMISNVHV